MGSGTDDHSDARSAPEGIVVAYDGTPDAHIALTWAAETAALSQQPVLAVMVAVTESPIPQRAVRWGEPHLEEVRESAAHYLEGSGLPDVSAQVRRGPVVPTLLKAAQGAALLVAGSQGHGQVTSLLEGSVSQQLAHHATCPYVVARAQHDPRAERIIVGVDGSSSGRAAIEFACRRAEMTREAVVALHADPTVPIDEVEQRLAEEVAAARHGHPDVVLETKVVPVSARHALVDASSAASLVVVGSRGLGGFTGLLLGSVSQAVLQQARCPVAVVR